MTLQVLEKEIEETTTQLLNKIANSCHNTISEDCEYIISEIEKSNLNDQLQRVKRIKANKKKEPKTLTDIAQDILALYPTVYKFTLYMHKAKKKKNIIDIRYYSKANLNAETYKNIQDDNPIWTSKVRVPSYIKKMAENGEAEKFNVNWEIDNYPIDLKSYNASKKLLKEFDKGK